MSGVHFSACTGEDYYFSVDIDFNRINQFERSKSCCITLTLFLDESCDIRDYLVVAGVVEYLVTVALI